MIFNYAEDKESYNRIMKVIETSYNLEDLRIIKKSLKSFFVGYLARRNTDPDVIRLIQSAYSVAFKGSKKEYAELFALIFISKENFSTYFQWFPKVIQAVWGEVMKGTGISSQELFIRHNIYIPGINTASFVMKRELIPNLCFFLFDAYYNSTVDFVEQRAMYYFYLPPALHSLVITLLFTEDQYEIMFFDKVPEESQFLIYENRQEILTNIPVIRGVEQQGHIILNSRGNINLTTVSTVERRMEMSEFFHSVIREVSALRGYLVLTLYTKYKFSENLTDSPEKYIKHIFNEELAEDFSWLLPSLLNHIKGYREMGKLENPGREQFVKIMDYLRTFPFGKWISVENLILHWKYKNENLSPLPDEYLFKDYLKFKNEIILRDQYHTLITVPFIKSVLFLLGAFGIVDMAYKDYSLSYDSYYESLHYFRLTEFGEYVIGKKAAFVRAAESTEKQYFAADENNLIIRSLEENNIYEKLLLEMAVPISSCRYKVTHISFLRSCKTPADIANRINFFYHFICADPSKIWIDFFESVKMRINPLTEVKSNFKLFQLDPTNIELLRLIALDPQIKKYVLKVESHQVLIKNQDLSKVIDRLKTYGYLL